MTKLTIQVLFVFLSVTLYSQEGIGIGTDSPYESAALDITSDNKGLLVPRTAADPGPVNGLIHYSSGQNTFRFFENGQWSGLIPAGAIIMWSGSTVPAGWALCDGNGTPDLSNRFIMGTSNLATLDDEGGSNSIQLTTSHLPSHDHTTNTAGTHGHNSWTNSAGSHSHGINDTGHSHSIQTAVGTGNGHIKRGHGTSVTTGQSTQSSTTGISIQAGGAHFHTGGMADAGDHSHVTNATGGGNAFDNRPAYYVLAFIIKLP